MTYKGFICQFQRCLSSLTKNGQDRERVVVTGLGVVSPLGVGKSLSWKALLAGDSGIISLEDNVQYQNIPCKVAAKVPKGSLEGQLDLRAHFKTSELSTMSLGTTYALIAAKEALTDARLLPQNEDDAERTGVVIGMGMVDLEEILQMGLTLRDKGYNKVSPYFIPRILTNMAAGQVSIKYGFRGPNHSVSTACATGLHAIGDAYNFIRNNYADVVVCGGTEAVISPLPLAAFARMKALSTSLNSDPKASSCPFDQKRDGFVMGEGAGILVLESLYHAKQRKVKPYAEILGYGLSGDAHHITAPHKEGRGAYLCMESALKDGGIDPKHVGYINAHATSTPLGDAIEIEAIKRLFRSQIDNLRISSSKGAIGHLLGAAGSVEAIFTILACHHGTIPPTLNLNNPDKEMEGLNLVPMTPQQWDSDKRTALKNSFGFGGTNASLLIQNYVDA